MRIMRTIHRFPLLLALWFLCGYVAKVEGTDEAIRQLDNENDDDDDERRIAARIAPIEFYSGTVYEGSGITTRRGRLGIDLDSGYTFSSVTVIEFTGTASVFPTMIKRNSTQTTNMRDDDDDGDDESSSSSSSAVVWYGEEITKGAGSATLMVNDANGRVFGSISDGTDSYSIKTVPSPQGEGNSDLFYFEFEVVSLSALPEEYEVPPRQQQEQVNNNDGDATGERSLRGANEYYHHHDNNLDDNDEKRQLQENTVVDVLVLYTRAARIRQGGSGEIRNMIDLGIIQTNMAFENSGSSTRVRLAAAAQDTSFPDDNSVDPLSALEDANDGYLDNVNNLRIEHGADIVMLIANDLGGYCGAAFLGGYLGTVSRYCATLDGQYSFAHEIGHMFYAMHDRIASGVWGVNRGYYDSENCFRSIMSYNVCGSGCNSCPRELYFSTQHTKYEGHDIGTWYENNIDTMDWYAPVLAGLKDPPPETRDAEHASNAVTAPDIRLCNHRPCEDHPLVVSIDHEPRAGDMTSLERGDSALNDNEHVAADEASQNTVTWDNVISRIEVPAGYYIEVFQLPNYGGIRRVFGGVKEDNGDFVDRVFITEGYGLGDTISSYVVREIPDNRLVRLCKKTNCRRGSRERSVGSYATMPDRAIGDNNLSRMDVPPRWSIELFDGPNFTGDSKLFVNEEYTKWISIQLVGENADWNDQAESFIISTIDDE